jgi:hypothetical protein
VLGHLVKGPDGPPELRNGGVPVEWPLDGGVPPRPDGPIEGDALEAVVEAYRVPVVVLGKGR